MKILKNYNIPHTNCIEHLFSNIILNCSFSDNDLLFINHWNYVYTNDINISEILTVYEKDFKSLYKILDEYYGITVRCKLGIQEVESAKKFVADNDYIALCLYAENCPWILFATENHAEHMALIIDCDEKGVIVCDNYTLSAYITYETLIEITNEVIVFQKSEDFYIPQNTIRNNILNDLITKNETDIFSRIIKFGEVFGDVDRINQTIEKGEFISNSLIRRINSLAISKIHYFNLISKIYKNFCNVFQYEKQEFELIRSDWLMINKMLLKYKVSQNTKILERIVDRIQKIYINEKNLCQKMIFKISEINNKINIEGINND